MSKRDYYEVLGVGRNAGVQEIKSAYRKLAVQYHPDRNPGDKAAEEKFKEAAEAYSVLGDNDKRARYDRFGHAGVGGAAPGFDADVFADLGDIFGDFFGFGDIFGSRSGRRSRGRRGADLRYDLTIDFEEAVFGVTTKIKIPREQDCEACGGSGAAPSSGPTTCPACSGTGQLRYQQGFFTINKTCAQCRGAGQIIRDPCTQCQGAGRIRKEKLLELKIPAGVEHGSRLRVAGEGEAGAHGGPPGDLYVVLSVREHPFFRRKNNDLYCEMPVTLTQAALGAEIEVPTMSGKEALKIPEGTQTGKVFRLKHHGVVGLNGRGQGDQYVNIRVVTPTNLNKEQKELLRQFAEISGDEIHESGSLFDKVKEMFG